MAFNNSAVRKFFAAGIAIICLSSVPVGAQMRDQSASGYKGEYILSRNQFHNPVCQRFTRNLNQFRRLAFADCHPRLSSRFPEFSRPIWEEIPFDLEVAERVVKGTHAGRAEVVDQGIRAEQHWKRWLEGSKAIREAGQAKMWRTQIDVDGDGKQETIIRLVPEMGISLDVGLPTQKPFTCDYNRGTLHMADNMHSDVTERFNSGGGDASDIIHFSGDGRYYLVNWNPFGPAYYQIDIGATSGVTLSKINWDGYHVTGSNECLIDWVPTGRYKPLKQHRR